MENAQNKFYSSISKYYSEIFPYSAMQQKFVQACVGNLDQKQILDIGCATGELAFHLAGSGATVAGIDLNEDLLNQAIQNKIHPKLQFRQGNMLELATDFRKEQFDAVLCFGNTLVHLQSEEGVEHMLNGVNNVLKPGGHFLLQILNYDYILGEKVSELPLIETENIRFIRNYKFQNNSALIRFQTDLQIKAEDTTVSNQTTLLALKSSKLTELLERAGFKNIQLYANFKQETFGGAHLPLVVSCRK
ncbi:class I SAM-dependent methyltransferase [Prolixibacteraceae bacterium Z1-6]|uniref:Class I SAM-dependent methyltransferase n=1 Tax=Draconibacterium aestuarii TaxID=2998507 RepID=A0A9X3J9J9_9BACT|nr:class I SAM-dependent methyltransferase [Prolixibacteraceae bacterium Z1-6]